MTEIVPFSLFVVAIDAISIWHPKQIDADIIARETGAKKSFQHAEIPRARDEP